MLWCCMKTRYFTKAKQSTDIQPIVSIIWSSVKYVASSFGVTLSCCLNKINKLALLIANENNVSLL